MLTVHLFSEGQRQIPRGPLAVGKLEGYKPSSVPSREPSL